MNIKLIDKHLEIAENLAISEVVMIARRVLSSKNKTHKFTMGMGTYFFENKKGEVMDFSSNELDTFISKYDSIFGLTGNPMTFFQKGDISTDW